MRITTYSDYSLRVLIYLATQTENRVTIEQIAVAYGISHNHLTKVVHQLSRLGYVDSVRGKQGGLRLRCTPDAINLGVLLRETETDMALVECMGDDNRCMINPVCNLKAVLTQALQAFLQVMDQYSLADILPKHQQTQLRRLLQMA